MTVAIYSCNFGNYRNELRLGIDNIIYDENIDYYFFTDNKTLTSKFWKIIHVDMEQNYKSDIMDVNRYMNKYLKFILPTILREYNIVAWVIRVLY